MTHIKGSVVQIYFELLNFIASNLSSFTDVKDKEPFLASIEDIKEASNLSSKAAMAEDRHPIRNGCTMTVLLEVVFAYTEEEALDWECPIIRVKSLG